MASIKDKIVTITKPTIKLDTLEFDSMGEGVKDDARANSSKGMNVLVVINNYSFDQDDILNLVLDCNNVVPTLELGIEDSRGLFNVDTFPRDGDVINLRIGTLDKELYKDIRMDFDITYVDTPTQLSDAKHGRYMFMGRAKIPGLYADECKSYGEGNSLQHIEAIATDLGLGFATNIQSANDSMHLIVPFNTRYETMMDLVKHSYVDDESFQTVCIDPYYNINYVNLNALFNSEDTFEEALLAYNMVLNDDPKQKSTKVNENTQPLFLSNHVRDEGTNKFITGQSLQNVSGSTAIKNGYKRTIQYYEMDSTEGLVSHVITPLSSKNMKDVEEPMRGRRDEDRYKYEVKYKYLGRRTGDAETTNVHLNYEYAAVANMQNMDECKKMSLDIALETFNPAIYRYQRVPIAIYTNDADRLKADKFIKDKKQESEFQTDTVPKEGAVANPATYVLDEFLSGYYIVGGITYTYQRGFTNVKQRLKLLRREWPTRINNINPKTVAKAPTPTVKVPEPVPVIPEPPIAPIPEPVPPPPPPPPPAPELTFELKALDWRRGYGSWIEQTRLFKWTASTDTEVTPTIKIKIDAGGPNEKILSGEVFTEMQVEGSGWNKKEYNAKVLIPGGLYEGKENEEFKVEITLTHNDITETIEESIKFAPWEPGKKVINGMSISKGKKKKKKTYSWAVFMGSDIGVYEGKYTLDSEAMQNATSGSLMSGVVTGSETGTVKNQTESAWKSEWQNAG